MPDERRQRSTCSSKLEALRWVSSDWFEIEGSRFGVRSTSGAFGEWVRSALASFRVGGPRDPGDAPAYSVVIEDPATPSGRATRNLHILYRGTFSVVRSVDASVVARSFLSEVESLTFPGRDDAIYLGVSVIRGAGTTVVIPARFVPAIGVAGRRIQRSFDIWLPAQLSVALDVGTGHLMPVSPVLDIRADGWDALFDPPPTPEAEDRRAFIDRELPIDRVLVWGRTRTGELGLDQTPKGPVLFDLARAIRNLDKVGREGVLTVARVVSEADVLAASWFGTASLIELLGEAVDAPAYVHRRTELTSVGA